MNELRDIFGDPVVIGAIVFTIVMMVMFRWFLKKMEVSSAAGADDLAAGAGPLGDGALQSKVGTPRARRLQPARSGANELNLPELNTATPSEIETGFPADSLAMAGEAAFTKQPEPAKPMAAGPGEKNPLPSTVSPLLAAEKTPAAELVGKKPEVPVGALVSIPGKPETKPLGTTALPPLAVVMGPPPGAATPEKTPATPDKPVGAPVAPAPAAVSPISIVWKRLM